jgi:hypothetical protein
MKIMVNRFKLILFLLIACATTVWSSPRAHNNVSMQIPLLRLKMVLDDYNYDDIAIGFLSTATTQYNNQIDSRYLAGIDAAEGLFSLSSDNVPLSVNIVPLPGTAPLVIRLDVEAKNSGPFTLERTELDSISPIYDVWLMDKYTKDSLNLRTNTSYAFNVNKSDTNSYGSNRFTVVIRQNPAMMLHLLSFAAKKGAVGNDLAWTTENEQSNTLFSVERSIDDGKTFFMLDSLTSNGSGSYTYTDKTSMSGDNLYRLKLQDMNGVITWSNIVSLESGSTPSATSSAANNTLSVYPNPSSGVIHLAINPGSDASPGSTLQVNSQEQSFSAAKSAAVAGYAIKIVNIKGVTVKSATASSASWQDNVSSLAPGTYIVQVTSSSNNKLVGESTFVKL